MEANPNTELRTRISDVEQIGKSTPAGTKIQHIIPDANERKISVKEAKATVFSELKYFNIMLTNACNLSCTYCFEQHKKDYGRFSIEKLNQMYDFLLDCNSDDGKLFQFFGGEPLSQKKLILEFCKTNQERLSKNNLRARVSIVTNGLLMSPEFVKEYFDYDFTQIVISLDTDQAEFDQREIGQKGIDHIFNMINLIPKAKKDEHQVCIRCTINQESVVRLPGYIDRLYAHGIRNFIIHPLILSRTSGALDWDFDIWNDMHQYILEALDKYPDFKISWAEGVGSKGNSNCMVGSDMISMDASGDFSGCYFFTNIKESFGDTMLGNLFNDQIYVDRYVKFQKNYIESLEKHEECRTCDLKGYCYQCPAGNLATGGVAFRPDGMCKRIVKLFLDLRNDITKKLFYTKVKNIEEAVAAEGKIVLSRAVIHLMYKWVNKKYIKMEEIQKHESLLPDYQYLLGYFSSALQQGKQIPSDLMVLLVEAKKATPINAYEFYANFCQMQGFDFSKSFQNSGTDYEEFYFIGMLHLLILDNAQFKRKQEEEHAANRMLSL